MYMCLLFPSLLTNIKWYDCVHGFAWLCVYISWIYWIYMYTYFDM